MEVGGPRHTLAALPSGKKPNTHCIMMQHKNEKTIYMHKSMGLPSLKQQLRKI
jgi:hypothetical protein